MIFEDISADLIQKCAKLLNGSGVPTQIDSKIWKHILCSRSYGREPSNLAETVAGLAFVSVLKSTPPLSYRVYLVPLNPLG